MIQNWAYSIVLGLLLFTSACNQATPSPTSATLLPDNTSAATALPATSTAPAPSPTFTEVPSSTSTATQIPPTPFIEPFLPPNLLQIDVDNIARIQQLTSLPVREIYQLEFSPSGMKLGTLSEPWDDRFNDYLEVWDFSTGQRILQLQKLASPESLFFSPDESQVHVFFAGKGIDIYDLEDGSFIQSMPLDVEHVDLSADGKMLATASYFGADDESVIETIDLSTGEVLLSFPIRGMVMHLEFTPDGSQLSTGSQVGDHYHISLWKLLDQTLVADLLDYDTGLIFSPGGSLAATSREGKVYLYSTENWVNIAWYNFADPYANPHPRDFSHSGDILAIEDRYTIRFLVPNLGDELHTLADECDVKFSPDGTFFVTWCYQSDLKIWGVMP